MEGPQKRLGKGSIPSESEPSGLSLSKEVIGAPGWVSSKLLFSTRLLS